MTWEAWLGLAFLVIGFIALNGHKDDKANRPPPGY